MYTFPDLDIVRPLGEGSVANVFLAREPALKRLVAVKVLRDELAGDDVARLRFEREAQTSASISHPNITSVYRVGRLDNAVPYMVMEYVEGRTLADLLAANGPLRVSDAKRVIVSVAHALAAAHRKGVVHRDVRPANVMWESESDRILLMDFGIAALLESGSEAVSRLTRTGIAVGDPLHMSPEQTRGEPVTQQSDVYQLGVLAHELLTGRPRGAHAPTLHEARSDVDPDLSDIVRRCVAANPQHRPRAADIAEALLKESRPMTSSASVVTPEPASPLREFIRELGRRKVYRVAVAYLAGAAVILQGAQLILPGLPVPDSDRWYRGMVAVTLAGFPIALVLSWLFDWTTGGIERTRRRQATRLLLPVIGLVASVALALALWLLLMP